MHIIRARNVCDALPLGLEYLLTRGAREASRNGPVVVAPGPVVTIYERPRERVLTSRVRDANPFFHLAESLWMLAGRDDAAFLNRYVKDFGARYADGEKVHGAYGHRWRHALGFDQLNIIVGMLRRDSSTRQAVLQMWDATETLEDAQKTYPGSDDLIGSWRDRPCNTHVYFRVREEFGPLEKSKNFERTGVISQAVRRKLDMTVCCRSNDMVMGAYGANAVHFSFLQEYVAARVGIEVGLYYQFSNNFHVYEADAHRLADRADLHEQELPQLGPKLAAAVAESVYEAGTPTLSVFAVPEKFDADLVDFMQWARIPLAYHQPNDWSNSFLDRTAAPMLRAHALFRELNLSGSMEEAARIEAVDWRLAAYEWLARRRK